MWKLSPEQLQSIKKSLVKYIAPLLLVFAVAIQQGKPLDAALYVVYGAALQMIINILSKLVTET